MKFNNKSLRIAVKNGVIIEKKQNLNMVIYQTGIPVMLQI